MGKNNIQRDILYNLNQSSVHPFLYRSDMMLVRWLLAKDPTQHLTEEQVRKSLYNIRKRKYIDIVPVKSSGSDDAEFKLELTNKGRDILKTAHLKDLSIEVPQSWDGKRRIIIFDLPET